MKKMWKYLLFLPLLAFMVSCGDDDDAPVTPDPEPLTLSEALEATDILSTLEVVVGEVDGLVADLEGRGAITVFAPNNTAFTNLLGDRSLEELIEDLGGEDELRRVLEYHVVGSTAFAADLSDGDVLTTLEGGQLSVGVSGGTVTVTDVAGETWTVGPADVEIANGVVHVINGVLIPDLAEPQAPLLSTALEATAQLSLLDDAIEAVEGLEAELEGSADITVFAPNNEAFEDALALYEVETLTELIEAIGGPANLELLLDFHVLEGTFFAEDLAEGENVVTTVAGQEITVIKNGTAVTVDDGNDPPKTVVEADVAIRNGVVHIIDGVLLPEFPRPTIVEALEGDEDLASLLAAVGLVDGLAATLLDAEEITVFAPDNDAFDNLRGETALGDFVTELGGPTKLDEVLKYHVVGGTNLAASLENGDVLTTLNGGQELTVEITGEGVFIKDVSGNTWEVTQTDIAVQNGVVHKIEGVLLPELEYPTIVEAATAANLNILLQAVTAAELGETLLGLDDVTVFAPTDAAFQKLFDEYGVDDVDGLLERLTPETVIDVLDFHVLESRVFSHDLTNNQEVVSLEGAVFTVNIDGDAVTLTDEDGSIYNVTTANVRVANGVVHIIDGVLLPIDRSTLVEAAQAAELNSLLAAVGAVDGLADDLLGAGAITVFAPTDEAFIAALAAFDAADLDELIVNIGGEANLGTVLGFHVLEGVFYADDLADGETVVPTLAGQDVTITKSNGMVTISDGVNPPRNVGPADVTIQNGVVHVIDGVLVPDLPATIQMTVGNSGASAYFVSEIIGGEDVTPLNENNSTWNLTVGNTYELTITGVSNHPFALRDANDAILLGQGETAGTFAEDADVNFSTEGSSFTFTLTQELADELDNYVCIVHPAMNGDITIAQ